MYIYEEEIRVMVRGWQITALIIHQTQVKYIEVYTRPRLNILRLTKEVRKKRKKMLFSDF